MTLQLIDQDVDLSMAALPEVVDLFTSAGVRAAGDALMDGGCRYLALDTSAVTCIDSTGITVLVAFWQRLATAGGALVLAVPDEHLCRRLNIFGLDAVFVIATTFEEAVMRARRLRAHCSGRPCEDTEAGTEIA
jgi:anti-anti-sigma factor